MDLGGHFPLNKVNSLIQSVLLTPCPTHLGGCTRTDVRDDDGNHH